MADKAKAFAIGYGRYLLTLGGATIAFLAGFYTCYLFALLPVVARYS